MHIIVTGTMSYFRGVLGSHVYSTPKKAMNALGRPSYTWVQEYATNSKVRGEIGVAT